MDLISRKPHINAAAVSPNDSLAIAQIMLFLSRNSKYEFKKSWVEDSLKQGKVVVFFINDEILGVASVEKFMPGEYKQATKQFPVLLKEHAHLVMFVVNRKFREKGRGKLIVEYMSNFIKKEYPYKFFSTSIDEKYLEGDYPKHVKKIFEELHFLELGRISYRRKYHGQMYYTYKFGSEG